MRLAGCNVTQFKLNAFARKLHLLPDSVHINIVFGKTGVTTDGIQRIFQYDVFSTLYHLISSNNRKCCRSGYFVGIHTYMNFTVLFHIFCDTEAGGIIRSFAAQPPVLSVPSSVAVPDASIAGHIHAVLSGRTGCVKYLHIKGDWLRFRLIKSPTSAAQRVTVQLMRVPSLPTSRYTLPINFIRASRKRVVCHDVFPRRSSLIAIFDRDLIGEHIANISFGHARGLSYNRVGFAPC